VRAGDDGDPVMRRGTLVRSVWAIAVMTSITASTAIAIATDLVVLRFTNAPPVYILAGAIIFNATSVLLSLVGGIIEWRRSGHTIGRLLLLSGPLYGFVSAGWTTAGALESFIDPQSYRIASWFVLMLSYPTVALIAGWVPLLFPTGGLPGRRWRAPIALVMVVSGIGLVAMAVRPGPMATGSELLNPIGFDGWPEILQPFVDALVLELGALIALAAAAVITRYRRGDRVERLQIRWFVSAVALCFVGFGGTGVAHALGNDSPPISLASTLVAYVGILLMPIAIGIAILRYRLFEIDRLISRTIGWTLVTAVLVVVFAGTVVGLQTILANVTQGGTLAVAASTLVAFALFQRVRRRIQTAVDHRFDRARYDGDRTVAVFGERLREQVDLAGLEADIVGVVDGALRPTTVGVWIRRSNHGGTA
jgi:hypothetical protein